MELVLCEATLAADSRPASDQFSQVLSSSLPHDNGGISGTEVGFVNWIEEYIRLLFYLGRVGLLCRCEMGETQGKRHAKS
jgi:hypothetical protein